MEFCYLRAGRGKPASGTGPDALDTRWALYLVGAKEAGLKRGGYWRFFPSADRTWQVKAFCDRLTAQPLELPPLVDIEDAEGWGRNALTDWAYGVLASVERETNKVPMLYTNKSFLADRLDASALLSRWPLALARWTDDPAWPDERATFWQYKGNAIVDWATGPVDFQRGKGIA